MFIQINSVTMNFEGFQISNVRVNFRGYNEERTFNINGYLPISYEEFQGTDGAQEITQLVRNKLIEGLEQDDNQDGENGEGTTSTGEGTTEENTGTTDGAE